MYVRDTFLRKELGRTMNSLYVRIYVIYVRKYDVRMSIDFIEQKIFRCNVNGIYNLDAAYSMTLGMS